MESETRSLAEPSVCGDLPLVKEPQPPLITSVDFSGFPEGMMFGDMYDFGSIRAKSIEGTLRIGARESTTGLLVESGEALTLEQHDFPQDYSLNIVTCSVVAIAFDSRPLRVEFVTGVTGSQVIEIPPTGKPFRAIFGDKIELVMIHMHRSPRIASGIVRQICFYDYVRGLSPALLDAVQY